MSSNKRIKVWKGEDGDWRWTYWASSDRVATSGEGFKNKQYVIGQVANLYPGVFIEVEGDVELPVEVEGEGE